MDRICVLKDHDRKEHVGIAAQNTSLFMRGYINSAHVIQIRRTRPGTRRKLIPAAQSSVSVLRRMRHSVERDNARNFVRAMNELPDHVERRLDVIARNGEESARILDPWMMLFMLGPEQKQYGKAIPTKADCLRAIDTAIAEARKPGRRENKERQELVVDLILRWVRLTKSDLRESSYEKGTSRRAGALADFIRELEDIWNVQLVSTNSGASMRKAILEARRRLHALRKLGD
jgi:hypothetical protein